MDLQLKKQVRIRRLSSKMETFPQDIKFKYPWRKYQQRVLDELNNHLTDRHLHVIAPPGSGKTILGLEVVLRLNQPTLILAPALSIRNQWIQRFCELFLQTTRKPDWISTDIRNPKLLTIVTYQGLHAACNNLPVAETETEDEEETEETTNVRSSNVNLDNIARGLWAQKIKTIVVDEAHHLKNEWWQTLTKIKEKLDPVIVGLTATPPYDVSVTEWQRYIELNGPVDTEISVPELVIEGDLCPHQDYVHFTYPTENEYKGIVEFRRNTEQLFQEIKNDETLIQAIESHPVWQNPTAQLDWIYTNVSCFSACLIFLNEHQKVIPETHLSVIGSRKIDIPKLDYEWMETLLDFYLFKDKQHFKAFEEHQKTLENRLKRYGVIEKRQISFSFNKRISGLLTSSISKLNGIQQIVNFEYEHLGGGLRMVILADFIRKEFFINGTENNLELNRIGVMPIFEKLRRDNTNNKKIGVLTGSMVILPVSAGAAFESAAAAHHIPKINLSPVSFDSNYVVIHQTEQLKHDIVHLVTHIFQKGEIEILIGTKSLLGEGWDAPAINALIPASFVGSFVLSNQMRGRAIRTQNDNDQKTGNIWHLVCVDPTVPTGGDDFDLLNRRFRSFVGVSFKEETGIENGVGRLDLPENIQLKEVGEAKNREMFALAGDRESLKQRWEDALATGITLEEEIKIPFKEKQPRKTLKSLYFNKTIANLLAMLGFTGLQFAEILFRIISKHADKIRSLHDLIVVLSNCGIIGILIFGRQAFKTLRLYIKYRDIGKDIQQIGNALLNSLIKAGAIRTDIFKVSANATIDSLGGVYCHLEGGTTFEKSTFINALKEILARPDNPRYVIVRKSTFLSVFDRLDYHAVPEILAKNKHLAGYFRDQWQHYVGPCDLVFTRTIEGRRLLLLSRIKSLASQIDQKVEHVNKWK